MPDPQPPPSWSPADVLGPQAPATPVLDRPPGAVGDLGPGTLDLSLPTDDALMAAATPNPQQARDRIATGNPASITALADRFARAGAGMEESYAHSDAAQRQLAGAFANNGAPVYDRDTHFGALPRGYRDTGTRLRDLATRLGSTATELAATQTTATSTLTDLLAGLARRRGAWAAEVNAARNAAGLIPYAAVPALTARRTTIATGMQQEVNTAGTTITAAITTYEDHLRAVRALIADSGHAGFVNSPFTDTAPIGGEQLRTPTQPGGPLAEIFPDHDGLPRLEGGYTPIPGGPEVLVTIPGPAGPTTTGQGQLLGGLPALGLGTNHNISDASAGVSGEASGGQPGAASPIPRRLEIYYGRLDELPPAATAEDALSDISMTLVQVEDQYSGITANPNPGLAPDGRMYPPMEDRIERLPDGGITAVTRGHRIDITPDGTIRMIDRRSGQELYYKRGGG